MSLHVVYTDDFPLDLASQVRWFTCQRDEALALDYARAVSKTIELLARYPSLGQECDYPEPELAGLRLYLVEKPFQRHLIYYLVRGDELVLFRVVSGNRDLPRRLLDPPDVE